MESSEWRANESNLLERFMKLVAQQQSIYAEWMLAVEEDRELERIADFEKLTDQIDEVLDKVSFSAMTIPPENRRSAVEDYLRSLEECDPESGFVVGWHLGAAQALAMAQHYRRTVQPNHAAAVYEYIDHLFHHGHFRDESRDEPMDIENYLPQMIEVYGELQDWIRLIELRIRVKDAVHAGALDETALRSAEDAIAALHPAELPPQEIERLFSTYVLKKHGSENELENAMLDINRLNEGVLIAEEKRKAVEWMDLHHSNLVLTPDGKRSLIAAKMCSEHKQLRDEFSDYIPVLAGKAIEAEFDANIWKLIRDKYLTMLPEQYRRGTLSINQIYRLFAKKRFHEEIVRAILSKEHPSLFDQNHLNILDIVCAVSTKARHGNCGQNIFTSKRDLARLENALQLGEKDGWIYRFLHLLNRGNRNEGQVLR